MAKAPADRTSAPPTTAPAPESPAAGKPASTRTRVDWEAVERDYRTGQFTETELATKHGSSRAAVNKHARKYKWTKDLQTEIRQATNAKLVAEMVATEVAKGGQRVANVVLAAAEVNKTVILSHRNRLGRIAEVAGTLMAQIEQAAQNMPDLSEVIEMVRNPDDNGVDRANDALRKAMDRPQLVEDLKKLAEINERVIKGERQAFRLDEAEDPEKQKAGDKALTDAERAVRLYNLLKKAQA
jgi:hypothetical protein